MNNKMFSIIYWIIACSIPLITSKSTDEMLRLSPKIRNELSLLVAFPHLIRNKTLVDASRFVDEFKYSIDYPILTPHTVLYQCDEKDTWSYGPAWNSIPPFKILHDDKTIHKDRFFSTLKSIDEMTDILSSNSKDKLVLGFVDTFPETELNAKGPWKLFGTVNTLIKQDVMFIIFATEEVLHNWMQLQIRLGAKTFIVAPLTAKPSLKDLLMVVDKAVTQSTNHIVSGKGYTQVYFESILTTLDFYDQIILNHKKKALPYHLHLMYYHPYKMLSDEAELSRLLFSDHRLFLFKKYIANPYKDSEGTLIRYNDKPDGMIIETRLKITEKGREKVHPDIQFVADESLYMHELPNNNTKTLIDAMTSLGVSQLLAKYSNQGIKPPVVNLFMIPVSFHLRDFHTIKTMLDPLCYMEFLYNTRVVFTVLNMKTKKRIDDALTNACFAYTVIDGNFYFDQFPHIRDEINKLVTSKNVHDTRPKLNGVLPWMDQAYPIKYEASVMFVLQSGYNNFQDATNLFLKSRQYFDHLLQATFNQLTSLDYYYSTVVVHPIRGVLNDNCSAENYSRVPPITVKHISTSTENELSLTLYKSIHCSTNINMTFKNPHAMNIVVVFLDNTSLSAGIEGILHREKLNILSKIQETHTHLIIVGHKGLIDNNEVLKTGPWTVVEIENKYEVGLKIFKSVRLV